MQSYFNDENIKEELGKFMKFLKKDFVFPDLFDKNYFLYDYQE